MKITHWLRAFASFIAFCGVTSAHSQTTAGAASVIVIPLVSNTASFAAEVFVRNVNSTALTLNVYFYDGLTTPQAKTCAQLVNIPSGHTVSFTLASQCTFNVAFSHAGTVILEDAATPKINLFHAFARVQNPGGIGFSVEGFPIGNFSGTLANVLGIKRQAAAPGYQTNCFVAALGESVNYTITLFDSSSAQIGSVVSGSLAAFQVVRYLDIFTVAGAPAGDITNARAAFTATTAGSPSLVGYCTVQENSTFGADFRIAKSQDALDSRAKRLTCYGQDSCGTVNAVNPTQIPDASTKFIHSLFIQQPDYVACSIVSPNAADLQIQIRGPGGDVFAAPVFASSPPFSSGGAGQQSFYIFTGQKSTINNGSSTRWFIDVGFRTAGGNPAHLPVSYGITCNSGNGVSVPYFRAQAALDF